MPTLHPSKLQPILIILAIIAAFYLSHFQAVKMYSLQIFMVSIAIFFIIKRMRGAQLWHIMPDKHALELSLLTFSFVFLIGASGNTHSMFFSLSYVHLFFLVFSTSVETTLATIIAMVMVHFGLEKNIGLEEFGALLSIPIIGALFLFAKKQYDQMRQRDNELIEKISAETRKVDQAHKNVESLEQLVNDFIKPKLMVIQRLLNDPTENNVQVDQQLSLLETELDKVITRLSKEKNQQETDLS